MILPCSENSMLIRSQSSAANEAQHFGKQFPFSRAQREGGKKEDTE